ncbi:MAG: hypothetical protein NTV43_15565 [Methylococcales bacterium]|nr:hypothetical protein [Methylococcales bacterium]
MILQEQLFEEIALIPTEKYAEVYDFLHYFRLGLIQAEDTQIAGSFFNILTQLSDDFMSEGRNQLPLQIRDDT